MIFKEQKTEQGYLYDLEEVFGKLHLESSRKIEAETLDGIVCLLLKNNSPAGTVKGEVVDGELKIKYVFEKASTWEEDEKEQCENTPTSILKLVRGFVLTILSKTPIVKSLVRFAVVFKEAWRRIK